jgi:Zn-dependent protease
MSLHESLSDLSASHPVEAPEASFPPVDPDLLRLRAALSGLLTIAGEEHGHHRHSNGRVYIFRGELQRRAGEASGQSLYDIISARFKPLGFTPLLQRQGDEDAVIAVEGAIPENPIRSRWWLHLLLLLITLATTTMAGATLTGTSPQHLMEALSRWDLPTLSRTMRGGLPFSLTLLTILCAHEMGHYLVARRYGVKVTLPFFVPLPLPGSLGTMGAVIFIRSPLMNRRALFDMGIAGPLAGLALALPLFLIGLHVSPAADLPRLWTDMGINRVANPPLLDWMAPLVVKTANLDRFVFYRHPMALAAWFGVLLTALNLLPLGQFDGGHVAYALLGRRAWTLAWIVFAALTLLGLFGRGFWFGWLIWASVGLLSGLRHPPPHDDLAPLGWRRALLGVATAILLPLIFVPVPFYAR